MSQMSPNVNGGGGNNSTPPPVDIRSKKWCFTINNYDQSQIDQVVTLVSRQNVVHWVYGFEEGKSGTPHIQGFIQFRNVQRGSFMRRALPGAHLTKAKGTEQDNLRYCSKDGNFQTNIVLRRTREEIVAAVRQRYENVVWRPWQQNVIDIVSGATSQRTIYWLYEKTGAVGKTFLCKFLSLEDSTLICEGKKGDVFNQVNVAIEAGIEPKLVICDIPRVSLEYVSYQSLEALKNGLMYSGKYEGGKCIFNHPKVVCFANELPKINAMSLDRWMIYRIENNELVEVDVNPHVPVFYH